MASRIQLVCAHSEFLGSLKIFFLSRLNRKRHLQGRQKSFIWTNKALLCFFPQTIRLIHEPASLRIFRQKARHHFWQSKQSRDILCVNTQDFRERKCYLFALEGLIINKGKGL